MSGLTLELRDGAAPGAPPVSCDSEAHDLRVRCAAASTVTCPAMRQPVALRDFGVSCGPSQLRGYGAEGSLDRTAEHAECAHQRRTALQARRRIGTSGRDRYVVVTTSKRRGARFVSVVRASAAQPCRLRAEICPRHAPKRKEDPCSAS